MKYQILGETLPVVVCELEGGERMITESGSMAWMSPNMKMETSSNGGFGKAIGRMFAGEKIFQNIYTAQGGAGMIAFASSFPGSIRAFQIEPGREMIFQKSSFLAGRQVLNCRYFLIRSLLPVCLAARDLLCRNCQDRGLRLRSLTDMWLSMSCSRDSRSW